MAFVFRSFESARALLDRAAKHLQKLDLRVQAFRDLHCSAPFPETDLLTGDTLMKIRVERDPSPEIACLTFDIMAEIRATLDFAVYDAALLITGRDEVGGTKFPFGNNAADARNNFDENDPPFGLEELRDFIVDHIQPYDNGRGEPLRRLNKMRNLKIHRVLAPTVCAPQSFSIGGSGSATFDLSVEWDGRKKELTFLRLRDHSGEVRIEATMEIAFDQGSYFPGLPVVATLRSLHKRVETTVTAVEQKAREIATV